MNIPAKIRGFVVLIILCAVAIKVGATTLLKVDFDEVVGQSEFIFEGRVIAKETRRSNRDGNPLTYVTFQVLDVLKGSTDGEIVTLGFTGGAIDGKKIVVQGLRMPVMNERGIYFVESLENEFFNPLYGWHQGHYLVTEDASSGLEYVSPVLEAGAPPTISPLSGEYIVPKEVTSDAPTIRAFKGMIQTQLGGAQ